MLQVEMTCHDLDTGAANCWATYQAVALINGDGQSARPSHIITLLYIESEVMILLFAAHRYQAAKRSAGAASGGVFGNTGKWRKHAGVIDSNVVFKEQHHRKKVPVIPIILLRMAKGR